MRRGFDSLVVSGALLTPAPFRADPDPPPVDLFDEALAALGASADDLGYRPKGYWNRFPLPSETPYVLPFFEDLLAEPMAIYPYAAGLREAAARHLAPGYRAANEDAVYQILYGLGVSRHLVGLRGYGPSLAPPDSLPGAFSRALRSLIARPGATGEGRTFGRATPWPDAHPALARAIASLPPELDGVLGTLLRDLRLAYDWWEIAFRNVPAELRERVFGIRRLGETQPDATVYHPELDDVSARVDRHALDWAALQTVAALERARRALERTPPVGGNADTLRIDVGTPLGRVVVRGTGADAHEVRDALLVVDLGGDDAYTGAAGGTSSTRNSIAVVLDLAGNDAYTCSETDLPSQGAGVLGVGVLWDVSGDDRYETRNFGQGAALVGVGVLVDEAGTDEYVAEITAQGAAFFGIGMLVEGGGSDSYDLDGDGQGFGGVGGVGVLADASGNDRYYVEPYAAKVGRADYHSDHLVAASHAQGAGSGRRGDGSDGHAWAGGLGVLVDIEGDDEYVAGNWSQGIGYWFGTGMLIDAAGDDRYRSVYFTQASAAHFAIGALVDEGGDDTHELFENAGAGLAFGWDFTNTLLFDRSGNDRYAAKIISVGLSMVRSNAFLVDLAGDDTYEIEADQLGMGASDVRDDYVTPNLLAPYNAYAASFGMLLDGGGRDRYLVRDGDVSSAHPAAGDGRTWLSPDDADRRAAARAFGIGIDREGGVVVAWEPFAPESP